MLNNATHLFHWSPCICPRLVLERPVMVVRINHTLIFLGQMHVQESIPPLPFQLSPYEGGCGVPQKVILQNSVHPGSSAYRRPPLIRQGEGCCGGSCRYFQFARRRRQWTVRRLIAVFPPTTASTTVVPAIFISPSSTFTSSVSMSTTITATTNITTVPIIFHSNPTNVSMGVTRSYKNTRRGYNIPRTALGGARKKCCIFCVRFIDVSWWRHNDVRVEILKYNVIYGIREGCTSLLWLHLTLKRYGMSIYMVNGLLIVHMQQWVWCIQ